MTILMFGMQYLHHQLHHQQLFFRLVISVFQRPRVSVSILLPKIISSYLPEILGFGKCFFVCSFLFLSAVAAAVFVVMSWELISPSPETSLNERICIVGVFFVCVYYYCCCYLGSGREGGIKNLQDADKKEEGNNIGSCFLYHTIPVKMYFHFDYSSYCFLYFPYFILKKNITLDYTIASSIVYWNMMMEKKNQFKVLVHAQHLYWYFSLSDLLEDSFIMFLYLC